MDPRDQINGIIAPAVGLTQQDVVLEGLFSPDTPIHVLDTHEIRGKVTVEVTRNDRKQRVARVIPADAEYGATVRIKLAGKRTDHQLSPLEYTVVLAPMPTRAVYPQITSDGTGQQIIEVDLTQALDTVVQFDGVRQVGPHGVFFFKDDRLYVQPAKDFVSTPGVESPLQTTVLGLKGDDVVTAKVIAVVSRAS